jgi:para-nitrobenzyl esterase
MRIRLAEIVVAIAAIWSGSATAGPSVIVDGVTIDGAVSSLNSNVDIYFGIPYATASRWSPPHAHAALTSPFDASKFSTVAVCPQNEPVEVAGFTLTQSEDCLSLNVYVPASATPTSKLPVLFWIFGGELENGASVEYNAYNMIAANDIIVVTINYRLGALGWLAQQAFAATKSDAYENIGDAGNYGLMDQQFAMKWVKDHIAAFGGDPSKVTIGGQSAGGLSVALNLASTTTGKGLFRGAIIESGAYRLHNLPSQATYEANYGNAFVNDVLAATGTVGGIACSALTTASAAGDIRKCLDGATVATILTGQEAAFGVFGYSPDFGTLAVPSGLQQAFAGGNFIHVPVLLGTNADEGRYFEPGQIPFLTSDFNLIVSAGGPANYDLANVNSFCGGVKCSYVQEINLVLTESGIPGTENTSSFDATLKSDYALKKFPDAYLPSNAPSADEGIAQIVTDYDFACNGLDANTELAQFVTVYAYEFNDPMAPPTSAIPAVTVTPNDQYGYPTAAQHGSELQFLFNFPSTSSLSADEQDLENTMQSYWTNFVKNRNPNGSAAPSWPAFKSTAKVQRLVPGPQASSPFTTFGKEHFCTIWEPIISAEAQQ